MRITARFQDWTAQTVPAAVTLHLTNGKTITGTIKDCEDEFVTVLVKSGMDERPHFVAIAHIVYFTPG